MTKISHKLALMFTLFFSLTTNVFAMQKDPYLLEVGEKGLSRMQYQHDLIAEDTNEHLAKAGPLEGKKVLDVGCGFGLMTVELAKRVGNTGHVYALDKNKDQLNEAKKRVADLGLKNVTFIEHDATLLGELSEKDFDLICIRFVLSHIESTPQDVVTGAKSILKEGGIILSQDIVMHTKWRRTEQVFIDYQNLVETMAKKAKCDYNIGERLKELHEEAGLTVVEDYFRQIQLTVAEAKKLFLLEMAETGKVIELGIVTPETVNNWKNIVSAWPEDDKRPFYMPKMGYVVAQK